MDPSDDRSFPGRVQRARTDFESAWKAGRRPRIEQFLAASAGPERSGFLKALLALEIDLRRTDGETPALHDYLPRFPGDVELLESCFSGDQPPTQTYLTPAQGEPARTVEGSSDPPRPAAGDTEPATDYDPGWSQHSDLLPETRPDPEAGHFLPSFVIPGFEILGELGRGGMGVVYRARQLSLGRDVALKVLPPAFASDLVRLQRFRNEATIAARLTDSRIVPVYEILNAAGTLAIVMPYIDGSNLDTIINDRKRALERGQEPHRHPSSSLDAGRFLSFVLPLLDQVVDAVASIHDASVLHRDIKPSNILVDGRGNVRLTDFGLARLGTEAQITAPGVGFGTPGFMSPEQWEGLGEIDSRVDVFSLGATLYYALTLELPYGRKRITNLTPAAVPPSKRQRLISADFDFVLLKALELDRKYRYGSATELREDWHRVRSGLLPRARRASPAQVAGRWVRRHPRAVLTAGIVLLCLATLASTFLSFSEAVFDSAHRRLVTIRTDPPGARFVAVSLNRFTGEPEPGHRVEGASTPGRVRLAPGDYLIVVQWPDGRFHEVYRRVPELGEQPTPYRHRGWREEESRHVTLAAIDAPSPDVLKNMVLFETNSGQPFDPPDDPITKMPLGAVTVPSFYLDRTEVTNTAYLLLQPGLPVRPLGDSASQPPDTRDAVRYIDFARALHLAEQMGKRLPEDAEYLFAATQGGRTKYPWGDTEPESWGRAAQFGPVGSFSLDRTPGSTPVLGLFSNVAEWTQTRPSSQLNADLSRDRHTEDPLRIVRGAPPSVIEGKAVLEEYRLGPAVRVLVPADSSFKGAIGFRCARSAAPRFLKPQGR